MKLSVGRFEYLLCTGSQGKQVDPISYRRCSPCWIKKFDFLIADEGWNDSYDECVYFSALRPANPVFVLRGNDTFLHWLYHWLRYTKHAVSGAMQFRNTQTNNKAYWLSLLPWLDRSTAEHREIYERILRWI